MATITLRQQKGSPLTNQEIDDNFLNLNNNKVELSGGTLTGNLSVPQLTSSYSSGDTGGTLLLNKPSSNTTINTSVSIKLYQNKLQFSETNGTYRGAWLDITGSANDIGSLILTSTNYNSYSPTLGGTGATGTWPISVTGNSATVTSITSSQVTSALGYTPYSSTNPSNFISANQTITLSGDVSGSGNIGIAVTLANSGVTAGTYGSSTNIPQIIVNAKGLITSVSNVAVSIPSGSLTFTGDVTGTGTTGSSTTLTLANSGVTAGTYTKLTVDSKGRVTSATTLASSDLPTYTGTITSSQVTSALGYTPYNSTNPNGYITSSGSISGNAATATNISNTGTVTLASATEANSIYITAPSYTTDAPVKLLNFDWYGNLFSIGNIRSGSTPTNGFGIYYTASGGSRTEIARFGTGGSFNAVGAITQAGNQVLHAGNYTSYAAPAAHDHSRIAWVGVRTAESGTTNSTASGYMEMVGAYNNGWPNTFGNVLSVNGGGAGQLFMGWIGGSGAETGELYYRSMTDWRTNWGSWRRILTNANWSEYAAPISHTHNYVLRSGDTMTGNLKIQPVSESWAEGLTFLMPNTSTWGGIRWQRQRSNSDGNWYIGYTALDSTDDLVFGNNNGGTQVDNILRLYKGGNVRASRDLYISGNVGGIYGNRLIVGAADTSYTVQDGNLRPTIQANGQYPVLSLNHTITSNTNHGPTIQMTANGVGNQFVIGMTGNGSALDIGYSSGSDWNPHNGIAGYNGTTFFRATSGGYMGLGAVGDWGALGGGDPGYHLHFKGYNNAQNGYAAVFENTINGANNGGGFLFQNNNSNHSWGVAAEIRTVAGAGGADRPSLLFSTNHVNTSWSIGFVSGTDDTFRIVKNHGHRAYYGGWADTNSGWGTPYFTISSSGAATSVVDIRSPIFYDSNDTGYYLNPNSGSNLAGDVRTDQFYCRGWFRNDNSNNGLYNQATTQHWSSNTNGYWDASSTTSVSAIRFYTGGHVSALRGYVYADTGPNIGFLNSGGNWRLRVVSDDYTLVEGSSARAPIFYDSNNTGYYVDANNYSNLNRLGVNGQYLHHTYGTNFSWDGASHYYWNRIATLSGESYIQVEIMTKTDANYVPFVYAIASFSTWNGSTFSIKLDALNSYDIGIEICFDSSNNCWIKSTAIWHSYLKWRIINNDGATIYDSITIQEAQPTNSVVCAPGQQARGTYGSPQNTSASTSPNHYYSGLTVRANVSAPIFYDSNDTGYYVDPNGTSNLNALTTNSSLNFYMGSGNRVRVYDTDSGPFVYNAEGTGATVRIGAAWSRPGTYSNTNYTVGSEGIIDFWISGGQKGYIDSGNNLYMFGSMRAPIFYDQNDTGYYVDPNSTSDSALRMRGGALFGPNTTWGAYLYVGGNGRVGTSATVAVTNGNLHIDSQNGYGLYLNWYSTNNIYTQANMGIGNDSASYRLHVHGTGYATSDFRAPILYDSNDTGYYLDLNGTSNASTTMLGYWYFRSNRNTDSNSPPLQAYSNDGGGAIMSFHRGGYYAVNFGLDSDNVIRIGGWSASTNRWQLDMSGNGTFAGNVTAYSDIRLKENIQTITNALSKVRSIRGVTFTRNDQEDKLKLHLGVIAQEVEQILPEIISQDNDGIKNVAYGNMVALLIEAIKEQQQQFDKQQQELQELKNLVKELLTQSR